MTSIIYKRCRHCGISYDYQQSGAPQWRYNHYHYCQECAETIDKVLETIPRKRAMEYVDIVDYDPELIKHHMKKVSEKLAKDRKTKPFPVGERLCLPTMKLDKDGNIVDYVRNSFVTIDRELFVVGILESTDEITIVKKAMERDLIEDKIIGPWREL